ncbi:hypothetical protein ACHAXT_013156 [Thalassiosira profunda]
MSAQSNQSPALPNELWIRSFSFLGSQDLFSLGNASRAFQAMASDDALWEPQCRRRWEGKQNVRRFLVRRRADGRRREGGDDSGVTCCRSDAVRRYCRAIQFRGTWYRDHLGSLSRFEDNASALNMSDALLHPPTSWKEAYIMAEMDSRRTVLTREELIHFKWQLIYGGSPSKTGLRQFNANGTYTSPYLGTCEWILEGRHLQFSGMALLVERDAKTWGWIVGRGQRTEYYSVDPHHI